MKNLFLANLHKKDTRHCTSKVGLWCRRTFSRPFRKLCNIVTKAQIIPAASGVQMLDEEYFSHLNSELIPYTQYPIRPGYNNIVLERYPNLNPGEPYIFACNHTCPEDIETVLNVLDRNAYMILGSVETLRYDPEMYSAWLNGMIPFDIMNQQQRKLVTEKMERVLKTNSILIFPEGSHNYSPNNLINPLYDGPANLTLHTGRKIVVVTMLRDGEHEISYMDVSQPVDISDLIQAHDSSLGEKPLVKQITARVRDKMATAVYYMMARHFPPICRSDYKCPEETFRQEIAEDVFAKLKWRHDVFEAEYLTKKTVPVREYEDTVKTLSNLRLPPDVVLTTNIGNREYILEAQDLQAKNVPHFMREYWKKITP